MKNHYGKYIVLFLIVVSLLTSCFYNNGWGIIDNNFYKSWKEIFEFLIVGRLVKSGQDGIFSAGGLLGIGSATSYDVTSKTIRYQYMTYSRGGTFKIYWTYKSTPGAEGIIYSIFDKYTNLSPDVNLRIFRASTALFSASILALLLLWFEMEFSFFAFALPLLFISVSPWIALLGGNVYWQLWCLYLPLVSGIITNEYFSRKGIYSSKLSLGLVFVTVVLKILFTGFEFISTSLVSALIPFMYFSIRDNWKPKVFIQRTTAAALTALGATLFGLAILLMQIWADFGNFSLSYRYIWEAFNRRAIGNPASFSGDFAEALSANVWSVIRDYLSGPALVFDGSFAGGGHASGINYIQLILVFLVFSLILLFVSKLNGITLNRKSVALLSTTWLSIAAPISWFIVFKAHAYIHRNLDFVVWEMPFTIFGFTLIGWAISQILGFIRSKIAQRFLN